tara:strand:+ start:2324 stop:2830 length:507 start_codon:yes stop_codon:yes gene_type:complete
MAGLVVLNTRIGLLTAALLLGVAGGLVGCSSTAVIAPESSTTAGELPYWQAGELATLDQGQHHPAVNALLQQAEQARQAGEWPKTMSYLDQARQIQPRNAAIFYRQGWVSVQMNQPAAAEQLLRRGLLFSHDEGLSRRIQWLLVDVLQQQGKQAEATQLRSRLEAERS